MGSGGRKDVNPMSITEAEVGRRNEFLNSISENETITADTKRELSNRLSDDALNQRIKEGTGNVDEAVRKRAMQLSQRSGRMGSNYNSFMGQARNEIIGERREQIINETLDGVTQEFETAKGGLDQKYKTRQIQKRTAELRADQPGLLQTRIVR